MCGKAGVDVSYHWSCMRIQVDLFLIHVYLFVTLKTGLVLM